MLEQVEIMIEVEVVLVDVVVEEVTHTAVRELRDCSHPLLVVDMETTVETVHHHLLTGVVAAVAAVENKVKMARTLVVDMVEMECYSILMVLLNGMVEVVQVLTATTQIIMFNQVD